MQEAISEAKLSAQLKEELAITQQNEKDNQPTSMLLLLKGFKKASPAAVSQGKARLLMEDMVHRAERKLSELKRKSNIATSAEEKAEGLAEELFHTPGKLLKENELAHMFEESGCSMARSMPICNQIAQFLYRTIDGTCNNLQQPLQGAANTPFQRLIPSFYEDGIEAPTGRLQAKRTVAGSSSQIMNIGPFDPPIPSARLISQSVIRDRENNELPFTHILMQWGQFLDHDMDLSPELEGTCQTCDITDNCEPIRIPGGDPVFGDGRGTTSDGQCLSFRRSIPSCSNNKLGSFSPREQVNDLTSYIDGSQIYGSDDETSNSLRNTNPSYLLKVGPDNNLPSSSCEMGECFQAGDVRVNEQVGLVTIQTLWVREHNRIATQFRTMNPGWTDEHVFQETRKLVGAILQKITYEDYLTKVLGQSTYDTVIRSYDGYNRMVDASIPNSFATAAYRYGHSLIQPIWSRFLSDEYENGVNNPLNLRASFFNRTAYLETGTDPVLRGLVTQNSRRMDEFLNTVLTEKLFQVDDEPGMDLASLNIQRGRDHGLAPYTTWRNFCQRKFKQPEISDIENQITFIRLLRNYGSLEDVDLWVGGLAEERLPSSLLGPTFACIFGLTFSNVRDGDRFYYEKYGVFTEKERLEISKASLSRVICDNTEIQTIQPDAFLSDQTRVNCNTLPSVNLEVWKEIECFAKISLTAGPDPYVGVIYIVDGVGKTNQRRQQPKLNQPICVPVRCPSDDVSEKIHIFAYFFYRSCGAHANPNLPPDEVPHLGYRYSGSLSSSVINANTGIYSTMEGCASGSASAVEYNCAPHIQENEQNAQNEEDEEEEDCSSPSSKHCDLPEDLEEEFNGMMSAASIKHHTSDITKADNTISDQDLLRQLEATLEELN